jgi:hypothetical protein
VSPPNTSSPPVITMVNEEKYLLTADSTVLLTICKLHTALSAMNPAVSLTYDEQRRMDYLAWRLIHELDVRPTGSSIPYEQFKTGAEDPNLEADQDFQRAIDDDLGIPNYEPDDEPDESQPGEASASLGRPGTHGSVYESRPRDGSSSPDDDPRMTEEDKQRWKNLGRPEQSYALQA